MSARILIIEDNHAHLQLMASLLRAFGHTVLAAEDGKQGLEAARRERPDLIVCNIDLPDVDGSEMARWLKSDAELRRVPLVAVTPLAMFADRDRVHAGEFDGCLSRPINAETFVRQIEAFLRAGSVSGRERGAHECEEECAESAAILVMDDSRTCRQSLVDILESAGHRTLEARDGVEGLAIARAEHPRLILTDILMPAMDGYEFVRQLRGTPLIANTPVILCTATFQEDEPGDLTRDCGASRLLIKPYEPDVVLRAVEEMLDSPREEPMRPSPDFHARHLRLLTNKLLQKVAQLEREILERQRAEAALRENEQLFARFMHHLPGLAWIKDLEGRYIYANDAAEKAFATPRAELYAKTDDDVFPPETSRQFKQADQQALVRETGVQVIETLKHDGVLRYSVVNKFPIPGPDGKAAMVGGMAIDITERLRAEEGLKESEERIRLLLDSTAEAIYGIDLQGNCTFANPACTRLLGYAEPGQFLGKNMHALIHHTRADGTPYPEKECRICLAFHTGAETHLEDEVYWRADGSGFPTECWSYPIRCKGQIVGSVVTFLDVTERKNLAAQFCQAQRRLQHVVASSPAVLFTLAIAGDRIQGVNWISDNLLEILGHPAEAALHSDWWLGNIHPEDRDRIIEKTHAELLSHGCTNHEYRFRHGDGRYRWMQGELRLIRDGAGQPVEVVGSWSDVTDRKQLEDQFRQSQKMEAVGQLAGGVAHDFNNLLTIINGCGELMLGSLPAGDPGRELIGQMVAAGDRAAGLTRQLLAFSRKAIREPKVLDLKTVVADVDKMLRRIIGEDVHLTVTADPAPGAVKADPGEIEQVILNLVVNARDAMPRGGKLTIEVRCADLDETSVRDHAGAQAGPHVLLAVSDTGCGMDARTLGRIFEPFFTTKDPGKGTGLGLATVYGIVKHSGGHIAVDSEVGRGTTFKVYLPRLGGRPGMGTAPRGRTAMPPGRETVLLVEDEDGVRALTRHILQSCGYTILEACDGVEALRIAGRHAGRIDLLMSDVIMPRMGGREAAERLAVLHPRMKVLYTSGYTDDAVVRHGILQAEVAFLQKPFSPATLAGKVREVLDQSGAAGTFPASPPTRAVSKVAESVGAPPVRILLVDDHSILRAGIRKNLQHLSDVEVVAEASDGREALAVVREAAPDVVFMDIAMEGLNGIEATARLTQEFPSVRVIILSMHAGEEHVWKALRAGAAGYLLKHADRAEIELALATVARGESYITPAVSQHIVAEFIRRGGAEASSVELLTSRQREILQLLAEGKTTKEIARTLSISAKTVETHRAQVMERLDIHDLAGLVRYAIRVGLIHPDG